VPTRVSHSSGEIGPPLEVGDSGGRQWSHHASTRVGDTPTSKIYS